MMLSHARPPSTRHRLRVQAKTWPVALLLTSLSCGPSSTGAMTFDMGDGLKSVWFQGIVVSQHPQLAQISGGGRTVLATLAGAMAATATAQRPLQLPQLRELLGLPQVLLLDGATEAQSAISLERAIELGINHSLDVQANQARADSFAHTRRAARGALLPKLEGRAAVGRGRLESDAALPLTDRKEGTITLRQPLLDAGAVLEWQRQSRLSDAAVKQLDAAINDAALETASAYMQALQTRMVIELNRDYERMLQELLDHMNARAAGGGASVAERDRVRARAANARAQIADSRANLSAALRNLSTLTGVSADALDLKVSEAWATPLGTEEAVNLAFESNPELLAARLEAQAARMEMFTAASRFLPRIELELSHTRNVNGGGTESYQRDSKAMVVMTWSLLNGTADYYQSRAALAREQEKQARAEDVQRKLRQQFDATYASLDAVADRIKALREEVAANASVFEAFRSQLGVGNRSLLDVLDACQRLHQSRLDVASLMTGELQNHLKVAHLTGRLQPKPSAPAKAGLRLDDFVTDSYQP